MWRKVIKKNLKKGLHKNANKVKISKDQLAHGLHRRNEPGDFNAALAARPRWGRHARRAERTGARGLRQVPRDRNRCGRCWWRFRSEPAGAPADDAGEVGRTHLPRAPRLRCSAPASASLPPRARALCPERHHGNRHRQRQWHRPAAPASRTHAPRAHHVPETEAVRLCLAVTVTPERGSCCRHFRTKDTEAFPGSPF